MFLSHEITHAIQDQHYDLLKMGIDSDTNDDQTLALSALTEGDATFVMNEYYLNNLNINVIADLFSSIMMLPQQTKLDHAPSYVKENLLFPYIQGLQFISPVYNGNEPMTLDEVFKNPPQSTEQILHPEKYFEQRDTPDMPELPDFSELK